MFFCLSKSPKCADNAVCDFVDERSNIPRESKRRLTLHYNTELVVINKVYQLQTHLEMMEKTIAHTTSFFSTASSEESAVAYLRGKVNYISKR